MSDPVSSNDPISNRETESRRSDDWSAVPLGGLAIVAVGLIFLARNFGLDLPLPDRWWAIFILLPAAGALVTAGRFYRMDGRFSSRVAGAATVGTLILATALILFLDLDWGKTWPVMVIIVGLGIVARGYRRRTR
jgi:hypothetical protein